MANSVRLTEWHKQYGPIISLKLGSDTLIVLNDREAIRDLWEKKSASYSDRAPSYVADLLTQGHHAAFQSMGDSWRDRRKLISHHFSPQQCDTVHATYQDAELVILG
jgi:cytochrome P450